RDARVRGQRKVRGAVCVKVAQGERDEQSRTREGSGQLETAVALARQEAQTAVLTLIALSAQDEVGNAIGVEVRHARQLWAGGVTIVAGRLERSIPLAEQDAHLTRKRCQVGDSVPVKVPDHCEHA